MALEPADAALVEPLRREQQVDPQAAPDPPDGDEQLEELWAGGEQLAKLVHHQQQVWEGLEGRVGGLARLVLRDPVEVAGTAKQALAALLLALEGRQRTVDQRQVRVQVGDQPSGVRQRVEPREGSAALEVDPLADA